MTPNRTLPGDRTSGTVAYTPDGHTTPRCPSGVASQGPDPPRPLSEVRDLGVTFHDVERADAGKRPVREIAGVASQLMRTFSRRREAIEQRYEELLRGYLAEHGKDPSRSVQARMSLYQQATLETREAKAPGIPLAERVTQWRATADRVLGEGGLERMLRTVLGADVDGTARTVVNAVQERDTRTLAEVAD